jgi:hypothetical protein
VQGPQGPQGSVGPQGAQGAAGAQGSQGAQGPLNTGVLVAGKATNTAGQALTPGWNKIPVNVVTYDVGAGSGYGFNLAQGRYNVGITGYYEVNAGQGMNVNAAGTLVIVSIYVNGVERSRTDRRYTAQSNEAVDINIADQLQLNVGDYVELYSYYSGGTAGQETGVPTTWLALHLINGGAVGPAGPSGGGTIVIGRAYRASAFTTNANGWTKIPLDTAIFDTGGVVSTANGRLVAPQTGYYQVNGEVSFHAVGNDLGIVAYFVNGSESARGDRNFVSAVGDIDLSVSGIAHLNTGDYVELYLYTGVADALNLPGLVTNRLDISLINGGAQGVAGPIGPQGAGAYTSTSPDAFFLAA